jgi:hypothetical protein
MNDTRADDSAGKMGYYWRMSNMYFTLEQSGYLDQNDHDKPWGNGQAGKTRKFHHACCMSAQKSTLLYKPISANKPMITILKTSITVLEYIRVAVSRSDNNSCRVPRDSGTLLA